MLDKKYQAVIATAFITFISFNLLLSVDRIGYDAARNAKIVSELSRYGTFTYFDVPFIASPPLYFILHSFPASISAAPFETFRLAEALMYFAGALLFLLVLSETGLRKKVAAQAGLLAFLLILADGNAFRFINTLDFFGAILLFTSLLLLSYARLFRSPTLLNVILFGLSIGLSMLVKSSFAFLLIPLFLHFLAFALADRDLKRFLPLAFAALVGLAIYSPWMHYLSSNGFPLITNPEFSGDVPWDPDFEAPSYLDVYATAAGYWPLLYPFSILMALILLHEYLSKPRFNPGLSLRHKIRYFYYRHRSPLGPFYLLLLGVIILLPLFNRLLVVIPVGEQFISIGAAIYLLLSLTLLKTGRKWVRYAIVAALAVSLAWSASTLSPTPAWSEYQDTCSLYTSFFPSLGPGDALLVDERLSRLAYPAHNVLYDPFFEWFSYQDDYDALRIVTMNIDYLVLSSSKQPPPYISSGPFFAQETHTCISPGISEPYESVVFKVDTDSFAESVGLPEKASLEIRGGSRPIQASVAVSGEGFALEYKSKNDGSLDLFLPGEGEYVLGVSRPGFLPQTLGIIIPADGKTLINLNPDSPLRTHTTANRY